MPEESKENLSEKYELSRKAAQITLARTTNYRDLWAKTEIKGNRKFIELTKKLWRKLAVHGLVGKDKKTGEKTILNFTDLDGSSCLGLLRLAGIKSNDVKYIAPSEFIEERINLDTGDKYGLVIEEEGRTAFFDHHTDEGGKETSATKITYEVLVSLGLLKEEEYLKKLVEFVTQVDNRSYPNEEKYFKDSWRTILGLQRFIAFKHLLSFFKAGRNPTEILPKADLVKFGLAEKIQDQKKIVENSISVLGGMERSGFIIPSERYGKIAIDIGKKVKAGFDAAKAYGCGAYIIWTSQEESFFISTVNPFTDEFRQGFKVRDKMWIKPRLDEIPLTITLREILEKMTDGKLWPTGGLREFLYHESHKS